MADDTSVDIAYDGPALASGTMDVNDLAPALLAIGDLFQAANRELNGTNADLRVQVKSDFKTGSFGIDLSLLAVVGTLLYQHHEGVIATAKQLAELVGLVKSGAVSLLDLVRLLGGKNPKPDQIVTSDGSATVIVDGKNHNVSVKVVKLYLNGDVRGALSRVLKPLRSEGVNEFQVREAGQVVDRIGREDISAFEQPYSPEADVSVTESKTMYVEVLRGTLRRNMRWRVSDGGRPFGALIKDEVFWRRLETGEGIAFVKGLQLYVRMRLVQHRTEVGLTAEYEIDEVLEVIEPPQQQPLP